MQTFTSENFVKMPWKNGGGTTTELFAIRDEQGEILFRISSALVGQNGPFSHYPQIDRIISLLSGNGFYLKFSTQEILIKNPKDIFSFKGEDEIFCELINGEVLDFNVMTNRSYANSSLTYKEILINQCISVDSDLMAIFIPEVNTLHLLEKGEVFVNETGQFLNSYQVDVSYLN